MIKSTVGKVFASSKVAIHNERIISYMNGENIYPVTMEIDLTQRCTRACPSCPYSAKRSPGLTLEMPFLDRLFSILGPHTPGIILSGGEPTFVPHFPEVVKLAMEKGFQEIAVISNGSRLHIPTIQDTLLCYVTSIRISMYDWQEGDSEYFTRELRGIQNLRNRIEKEGSKLEIGAAILTRKEWNYKYTHVGTQALNAGVHWVYFHPFCIDWNTEKPVKADQSGVLDTIEQFRQQSPKDANIQVPSERYDNKPLYFTKLHGSHFLIQVGADGVNYAGPECKYTENSRLLNLNEYMEDDFLWHPQRLKALANLNSDNYQTIGTRHRPPIFSNYIENLIHYKQSVMSSEMAVSKKDFAYPEIL